MSPIDDLREQLGRKWPCIYRARSRAQALRARLQSLLCEQGDLSHGEVGIVVFGSLARDEMTSKSDVDWTLLIDGRSDPQHFHLANKIKSILSENDLGPPGPTGLFGNIAFSHEIIHHIGGALDSNQNTTQRILLLLESRSIGSDDVRDRVIRNILDRYLDEDPSIERHPPRFLLNDIVRLWRTMAVDYVTKQRERAGKGTALRNIKLRMSRKLIFASGMLIDFACAPSMCNVDRNVPSLVNHLMQSIRYTPLEILANALLKYSNSESAALIFDSYERFLKALNSQRIRNKLDQMSVSDAEKDHDFRTLRDISQDFQAGLSALFFGEPLGELTKKYGVF